MVGVREAGKVAGKLSTKLPWEQANPKWASQLNPIIANPLTNMTILESVPVKTGVNVINHLLQKIQQGWIILDINAPVTLYRSAAFNDLTLSLTSSGPAVINLGVF